MYAKQHGNSTLNQEVTIVVHAVSLLFVMFATFLIPPLCTCAEGGIQVGWLAHWSRAHAHQRDNLAMLTHELSVPLAAIVPMHYKGAGVPSSNLETSSATVFMLQAAGGNQKALLRNHWDLEDS